MIADQVPKVEEVSSQAWRALAVGATGYVLFGFNSTATNLAFGQISDTFSTASETTVSWVASGFFIAAAAFLPLGGRLADREGRRKMFRVGMLGFVVSAVLSAAAPSVWVLIGARVLQAISGALVIPASLSMVLPLFPVSRRSTAVAAWASTGPLSAAIAPSLVSLLIETTSWRWVYFVTAPISFIAVVVTNRFVEESQGDEATGRLDIGGTLLAVASVAMLIVGISQGTSWGWTSAATILILLEALAMAIIFVIRSSNHPAPLLNLSLFRIPEVAISNVANLCFSVTSLAIWLVWPLWLGRIWDYSPAQIGLAITAGPIFAGPSTLLGGRLVERYGHRWPMIIGAAISTCAVLWGFLMLTPEPRYLVAFLPMIGGFGLGWGLSHPQMNSWSLNHVPQAVFGEVNAGFNTIRNLGAAIGIAGAISILGAEDRPDVLAAYDRAYLFFVGWTGMALVTLIIGTAWLARRPPAS